MRFDIVTLFPDMFAGPFTESMIKRAQQAGHISIHTHNIRDYTTDRHRTADFAPYGGGAGMVMKAEPLAAAIRAVLAMGDDSPSPPAPSPSQGEGDTFLPPVILMSPDGEPFTQHMAEQLSRCERLVLVCGHYEGVDERVRSTLITREISIGDYVLTGGELAAMVIVDAVTRLVPGVLDAESTLEESHGDGLLEYPHYTRPAVWEGMAVPPVLLSGNHALVARWRQRQRLLRTLQRRPDMLAEAAKRTQVTDEDLAMLWEEEIEKVRR
jgi:tRNA (guanine37-N1)-methyltransferase